MLGRIVNCLCHPTKLGLYHKDKIFLPIIFVLVSFLLYIGMIAAIMFTTSPFETNMADSYIPQIVYDNNSNIEYKEGKLSGNEYIIKGNDINLYFMKSDFRPVQNEIAINFTSEKAIVYYGGYEISSYVYTESQANDFSFADIIAGDFTDRIYFVELLNGVLSTTDVFFNALRYVEYISQTIMYFVILIIVITVLSLFINPGIKMNVRIKLNLYATVCHFVVLMFTVIFNIAWLEYVSYLLPAIYSFCCFTHIIRVKVKK